MVGLGADLNRRWATAGSTIRTVRRGSNNEQQVGGATSDRERSG